MRIAVDAMGGDHAPKAIVHGAVEAARASKGRFEVVLVGDRDQIETELQRHFNIKQLNISVEHAAETIEMHESPTTALRRKKNSSIGVAIQLHKEGKVDAVVSAGNTGAVMASSLLGLGRIKGVARPSIGSFLPTPEGVCLLIDVGANVDCKPQNLLQFAIMGSIFFGRLFDIEKPKVGLLSIGEEESKGNEVTIRTHQILKQNSHLNFIGNIEGRDIMQGIVDIAVCDGFVGNIILKFGESIFHTFSASLKEKIGKKIHSKIGALLLKSSFRLVKKNYDWEEYGGVPLLGINGVVIICHGKSSPKAILNAVLEAEKTVEAEVNTYIKRELEFSGE
ncbi:phosphate acyltransferase PlsX [candidate division KSB1 bacterium]|nr:phosphate acyltransferase PlsX [candidate division KSB1 bacterium]